MEGGIRHGLEDLTGFAVDVVRQAGAKALEYYGTGRPQMKFDESAITEAEIRLTQLFHQMLQERYPEHQVFARDRVNDKYSHDAKRYLWIFDALDGVANFQAGIPIWGVSVALLDNFWPILGAFFMPATNDLFYASVGKSAFWGEDPITISSGEDINGESLLLTYSRFHLQYHSTFPGKIRSLGCACAHICYVATGRADVALVANETFQGLAAARVIIEAAGGKIWKIDGGEFYLNEYLDGQRIDDHLLAATPEVISQVRTYLNKR
jgi:myo-inositol-1(or 4)-monophosphatase